MFLSQRSEVQRVGAEAEEAAAAAAAVAVVAGLRVERLGYLLDRVKKS